MADRGYLVRVVVEAVDKASSALKAVRNQVAETSRSVEEASKGFAALSSRLKKVGEIAGGVVAGLVGFNVLSEVVEGVRESIAAFADFEAEAIKLASLTHEAGQDVYMLAEAYRVAASAAARDFAVSAGEALQALEALVKAGLSGADAISALGAVVEMARLEAVDFATAGNNLVQVMAQFGIKGSEAKTVVDDLINASRLGIGAASDFAQGLANCGATARAMGLGLEDALTWLVVLERRLGSAEEAGTQFNRFLMDLYEIAGKLGVPIRDVNGDLKDTNKVILEVIDRARSLGGDFESLQKTLRGVDIRAVKALATFMQMTESFRELREEIGRHGSTWEAYKRWLETTQGKFAAMSAEADRMKRRIGESASSIATYLENIFLPAAEVVFASWRGIVAHAVGDVAGNLESAIEVQLALGRVTEEEAGRWIMSYVEMGRITEEEALKIAEHLGIMSRDIQQLIERATSAGESVSGSLSRISGSAAQLAESGGAALTLLNMKLNQLASSAKNFSQGFEAFGKAVSLAGNFYDVTLAVSQALGRDVELSKEAEESKLRLAATQQTLNYLMQSYGVIQQAVQLYQLGAKDAGDMLLATFKSIAEAVQDGVVTNQEFVDILKKLGVNAENVAGSLHNILVKSLKAAEEALKGNVASVENLISKLRELDGMEVTYRIKQIIVKKEEESGEAEIPRRLQAGAWSIPHTGYLAYLHRGEMVLPRRVAEWFRRGGAGLGGQVINISVNVNASGFSAPDTLAELVSREIARRLRRAM